ncbi:MAG: hypothetical protein ABSD41_07430 [Candidatus Bathyarchaeia archaeon]
MWFDVWRWPEELRKGGTNIKIIVLQGGVVGGVPLLPGGRMTEGGGKVRGQAEKTSKSSSNPSSKAELPTNDCGTLGKSGIQTPIRLFSKR